MKNHKVFERIIALFAFGGVHSPLQVDASPTAEPTPFNETQCAAAHTSLPADFPSQSQGEAAGTMEVPTPDLDSTLDVLSTVEAEKMVRRLLGFLAGEVGEKQSSKSVFGRQLRLENSAMNLDVQVFAARADWYSGTVGSAEPSSQTTSSFSRQGGTSGGPTSNSSPPCDTNCSVKQEPSGGRLPHPRSPPVALSQPHQIPPVGYPVSRSPTWSFAPTPEFEGPAVSGRGHFGGSVGGTTVMRVHASAPGPELQAKPDIVDARGGDGIGYNGGKHKFVCETCGQPFASKYNVERHQRTANVHKANRQSGEEGFYCGQCRRTLSRPDVLKRHERKGACGKRPGGSSQGWQGLPGAPSPQ